MRGGIIGFAWYYLDGCAMERRIFFFFKLILKLVIIFGLIRFFHLYIAFRLPVFLPLSFCAHNLLALHLHFFCAALCRINLQFI